MLLALSKNIKSVHVLYFNQNCYAFVLNIFKFTPLSSLHRYYVAEGVRIYSQETWHQVTGLHGKQLVEQHIGDVVRLFLSSFCVKTKIDAVQ